jgi:hypothetical protein
VPVRLLREQNLLCDIDEEHSSSLSAARKVWFRSTERRDFGFCACGCRAESSRGSFVDFLEPRLHGAFAGAARGHLYSSHLI